MVLSAKVLWPLFPLLLLVVVVSLTWALVRVVRRTGEPRAIWVQAGALGCYLLAAVAAIASEGGLVSAQWHRPFSVLTQVAILGALVLFWRKDRALVVLNSVAWAGILADTALHFVLSR